MHPRSCGGLGLDDEGGSQHFRALAHVALPVVRPTAFRRLGGGVEATAIILYGQGDGGTVPPQGDFQQRGLGMLEHVGDGLLGDVEELAFFLGGKAGVAIVEIERRGDAGVFGQEARGFA